MGRPSRTAGQYRRFGDTTTNRLLHSEFSNIYRSRKRRTEITSRPIMRNVVSAGVTLGPGTYWIDWQTDGSLGSGPWVPPVTITGQTTPAMPCSPWAEHGTASSMVDQYPQGLPFQLVSSRLCHRHKQLQLRQLYTHDPGTFNVIGNIGSHYFFSGILSTGDMSKIYAIDYNSNQLFSINTSTAAPDAIGPSVPYGSEVWTGMTALQNVRSMCLDERICIFPPTP